MGPANRTGSPQGFYKEAMAAKTKQTNKQTKTWHIWHFQANSKQAWKLTEAEIKASCSWDSPFQPPHGNINKVSQQHLPDLYLVQSATPSWLIPGSVSNTFLTYPWFSQQHLPDLSLVQSATPSLLILGSVRNTFFTYPWFSQQHLTYPWLSQQHLPYLSLVESATPSLLILGWVSNTFLTYPWLSQQHLPYLSLFESATPSLLILGFVSNKTQQKDPAATTKSQLTAKKTWSIDCFKSS